MAEIFEERATGDATAAIDAHARHAAIVVGQNLRRMRKARGHSLERLAELSGVSRAMLGQIETHKSVPTISLLWKVADALGVTVGSLLVTDDASSTILIRRSQAPVQVLCRGSVTRRVLIERRHANDAELCEISVEPKASESFEQQRVSGLLSVYVVAGQLRITIGNDAARDVDAGDAILFEGAAPYEIANRSDTEEVAIIARFPAFVAG